MQVRWQRSTHTHQKEGVARGSREVDKKYLTGSRAREQSMRSAVEWRRQQRFGPVVDGSRLNRLVKLIHLQGGAISNIATIQLKLRHSSVAVKVWLTRGELDRKCRNQWAIADCDLLGPLCLSFGISFAHFQVSTWTFLNSRQVKVVSSACVNVEENGSATSRCKTRAKSTVHANRQANCTLGLFYK
jgi:hypothetical protein